MHPSVKAGGTNQAEKGLGLSMLLLYYENNGIVVGKFAIKELGEIPITPSHTTNKIGQLPIAFGHSPQ